jgi:DNA-binding transcriptional regulator PaaX
MRNRNKQSALVFVLKGLVPYTRENLMLSFKPKMFFAELEKVSKYNQKTLRNAYYRGFKTGLIQNSTTTPRLTKRGIIKVQPYITTKIKGKGRLVVIFDIPEVNAGLRQQLRKQLQDWQFEQIQKSVWATDLDYKEGLIDLIAELNAGRYVEIYEGARLYP